MEHLVAGVSGGVAATVLLHPLDLLKIRFAVNDGQNAAGRPTYAGMKNAVANIGTGQPYSLAATLEMRPIKFWLL